MIEEGGGVESEREVIDEEESVKETSMLTPERIWRKSMI